MALTLLWRGPDGGEWNLTDESSVVRAADGLEGVHVADFDQVLVETPQPGVVVQGVSEGARTVRLPVNIGLPAMSQREWRAAQVAWRKSMTAAKTRPGTLVVRDEDGAERYLYCLLKSSPAPTFAVLPELLRFHRFNYLLVAPQPFWALPPVVATFSAAPVAMTAFLPTTAGGDFTLLADNGTASAAMANPGEREAWPLVVATGPTPAVAFGVGGHLVRFDSPLSSTDQLEMNFDPARRTVLVNGVNAWERITAYDPAPIPPGRSVQLQVESNGTGPGAMVSVRIDPLAEEWTS